VNEFYPADSIDAKPLPPLLVIERMNDEMVAAMRRMTVSDKLALVGKINREVRRRVAESIRTRHPEWSDDEIQAAFIRTMLTATYESLTEFMPDNILEL
jgi:hypothetical protein